MEEERKPAHIGDILVRIDWKNKEGKRIPDSATVSSIPEAIDNIRKEGGEVLRVSRLEG
jgi:hypothetical protein